VQDQLFFFVFLYAGALFFRMQASCFCYAGALFFVCMCDVFHMQGVFFFVCMDVVFSYTRALFMCCVIDTSVMSSYAGGYVIVYRCVSFHMQASFLFSYAGALFCVSYARAFFFRMQGCFFLCCLLSFARGVFCIYTGACVFHMQVDVLFMLMCVFVS